MARRRIDAGRLWFAVLVGTIAGTADTRAMPAIGAQPRSDRFVAGQTAGFRVGASGTGTLTYQWYRNDLPIAGATDARYYTAPATTADDGSIYKVVVTDDTGSLTSVTATLGVASYRATEAPPLPLASAATYHLDALGGNDTTGDGSAAQPFRSFAKVRPLLHGGEVVVFGEGDYGNLSFNYTAGEIPTPYTDWVTFMAAPGATPRITQFYAHGNWNTSRVVWNGNFEFRIRLIGFLVADGVRIADADLIRIERCAIRRIGPWSGSEANIGKAAVSIRAGRSITVEDCDITESAVGIGARGNDLVLRRNHVHEICHDGIQLTGCDQVLVEGNRIHNLDDGEDDIDPPVWNRHCDGLHIYPESDTAPVDANVGVTIRGNTIYHCESMGIMFQNRSTGINVCRDFVVENNVFGPSGGFLLHFKDTCRGFVFRHNSMLHVEGDSFVGRYRTLACTSYAVGLPTYSSSSGVRIYNNIIHGQNTNWGWINPTYAERFDHNLYHRWDAALAQGEAALVVAGDPFADATNHNGRLIAASAAINAGSTVDPVGIDLRGVARDEAPDLGALEARPPTSYTTWAAGEGLTGLDALPLADPDADSTNNLLEYAFGANPHFADPSRTKLQLETAAGALALVHRRSKYAGADLFYERSGDLVNWTPAALSPEVIDSDLNGDGNAELVRSRLDLPPETARLFLRLATTAR